jgi:hypothetical protein
VDFDFFSRTPFDPAALAREIPYLAGAEPVQVVSHTLTCRVERGGPVLVSFFGNLGLGEVAPRAIAELPAHVQERLRTAVAAVDPARLPVLTPHVRRDNGRAP